MEKTSILSVLMIEVSTIFPENLLQSGPIKCNSQQNGPFK